MPSTLSVSKWWRNRKGRIKSKQSALSLSKIAPHVAQSLQELQLSKHLSWILVLTDQVPFQKQTSCTGSSHSRHQMQQQIITKESNFSLRRPSMAVVWTLWCLMEVTEMVTAVIRLWTLPTSKDLTSWTLLSIKSSRWILQSRLACKSSISCKHRCTMRQWVAHTLLNQSIRSDVSVYLWARDR